MNSQRPPVAPKRSATAAGTDVQYATAQQHPPRSPYEVCGCLAVQIAFNPLASLSSLRPPTPRGNKPALGSRCCLPVGRQPSVAHSSQAALHCPPMLQLALLHQEEELRGGDMDIMASSASMPEPHDLDAAVMDRKAIRKEKNRASAAASRARREAYTASLEDEVIQ